MGLEHVVNQLIEIILKKKVVANKSWFTVFIIFVQYNTTEVCPQSVKVEL